MKVNQSKKKKAFNIPHQAKTEQMTDLLTEHRGLS